MATKLIWEEPAEFSRALAASTTTPLKRWQLILYGAMAGGAVALVTWGFELFFLWLHNKDLGVPFYFYIVAPVVTATFVALLPYMVSVIPAKIILTDQGVHRNKPVGSSMEMQLWPWESITELALGEIQLGGQTYPVLMVQSELEAGEILLGLGSASREEIIALAHQLNRKVVARQ